MQPSACAADVQRIACRRGFESVAVSAQTIILLEGAGQTIYGDQTFTPALSIAQVTLLSRLSGGETARVLVQTWLMSGQCFEFFRSQIQK